MGRGERIANTSLTGIAFTDLDGVVSTANDALLRMWRFSEPAELIGRSGLELFADQASAAQHLGTARTSGRAQGELVARRNDGTTFVVWFVATLARDLRGNALGVLGEVVDVTDLVQARDATAAQRHALKSIIDASPDWIFAKDLDHRLTLTNVAFAAALGRTPADLEGHLDTELWPADVCEQYHVDDRRAFAGELVHNPDDHATGADGSLHVFDTIKGPLRDERGQIVGVFGIGRDMTERRHTAEALRQLTADLEAMLDAFPDLVLRIDAGGKILDSRAGRLGPPIPNPSTLIGHRLDDVLPPPLVEIIRRGTQQALTTGTIVSAEYDTPEGLASEGRFVAVGPDQVLIVVRDITERRRAERALQATEERLRRAQKLDAVGRLAGGVAHDFNNLLTVIIGLGSVLRKALVDEPKLAALADDVVGAGARAAALTRQLLAFARAQQANAQVVDPGQLIRAFSRVVAQLLGDNVTLATSIDEGLHPVEVDPAHLEQVLLNLAVNARDAMPDGGTVTIAAGNVEVHDPTLLVTGPCVRISVRDHGTGMTDEVRARLFEPFFTTKPPGKGTGLGLATVYGIVRGANGDIAVESSPGAGSTFQVYLPRTAKPLGRDPTTPASVGGTEVVLVVEDDPLVRAVTCRILGEAGYRVVEASGGREALEIARTEQPFDAVISDVAMPGMPGPEMVEALRALRPSVKVLFVTGHAADPQALERLGRVLHKPFGPPALLEALRSLLDGASPHGPR